VLEILWMRLGLIEVRVGFRLWLRRVVSERPKNGVYRDADRLGLRWTIE
jgi:hypothetical protein